MDGSGPAAGLTADSAGNLYGTTSGGGWVNPNCGVYGCGTVFELSPTPSGWSFKTLYAFQGGEDGSQPVARVIIGPDGGLYGTTQEGGEGGGFCNFGGCGTVFKLTPSNGGWTETVIHRFGIDISPGQYMPMGALVFDRAGNLFGVTHYCSNGCVYELTPSGDTWRYTPVAVVTWPNAGVTFDQLGNLYGTTGVGYVYQLTPSDGGWKNQTIYSNNKDLFSSGVIVDASGNLYGTAEEEQGDNGSVFRLSRDSQGHWTYTRLLTFLSPFGWYSGPADNLVMDLAGNLYDTTVTYGEYGKGSVFKLAPPYGTQGYTSLHDFKGGADGGYPNGNVIFGPNGKLYGTTVYGGQPCENGTFRDVGCGTVFEITP